MWFISFENIVTELLPGFREHALGGDVLDVFQVQYQGTNHKLWICLTDHVAMFVEIVEIKSR